MTRAAIALLLGFVLGAFVGLLAPRPAASSTLAPPPAHPEPTDGPAGLGLPGTAGDQTLAADPGARQRRGSATLPATGTGPALVEATPDPASSGVTVSGRVERGIVSHVGRAFGPRYLALPEHRWGRPGIRVTICGDGGCVTRTSTDAGPDLAMQRAGRIADLNAWDFETVCGLPASAGLCRATVTYGGLVTPPPTETQP